MDAPWGLDMRNLKVETAGQGNGQHENGLEICIVVMKARDPIFSYVEQPQARRLKGCGH